MGDSTQYDKKMPAKGQALSVARRRIGLLLQR